MSLKEMKFPMSALSPLSDSLTDSNGYQIVTSVDWDKIDTVMLDMDGTIIDLCFDYVIWNQKLPRALADKRNISFEVAYKQLYAEHQFPFSLNFYSIDHWTKTTKVDLMEIHRSCKDLLGYRPGALELMRYLRNRGIRVVIATNCHTKSIALKDECLAIRDKVDAVYSSSELGIAKDDVGFWDRVAENEPFNRTRTLFVDDSSFILNVAWQAGIGHLMTVKSPNSHIEDQSVFYHPVIDDFRDLIPQ